MTTPRDPSPAAAPGEITNLSDRLNAWLGEASAIQRALESHIELHRAALLELQLMRTAAFDAIDRMRELMDVRGGLAGGPN